MNAILPKSLIFFFAISALAALTFGRTRASKEIPRALVSPQINSSISLDARNTAVSRIQTPSTPLGAGTTRSTTAHAETIEITAVNLGTIAQTLAVQWFWVGKYEKSQKWFRAGEGEKIVTLEPSNRQVIFAENTEIDAHETKRPGEHYKSGGNMQGWVVVAYNDKHEIQALKTSDHLFDGLIAIPPPKQRH